MSASLGRTLILVENLSVPFDRRVWHEAMSLRGAGYEVAVICPQGTERDTEQHATIDGVEIHRFPLRASPGGAVGYVREYATAFARIASLVQRLARKTPFDLVHACNPPDGLLLAALPQRRRGTAFIFDHHDLAPEFYISKFGKRGVGYRGTLVAERVAFRLADVVLSTNESYRRVALERGRKSPEDVFVVRSAPRTTLFRPVAADPKLKRGKAHLLAYVGVMGPEDGLDHALRALARLAEIRDDWRAVLVGSGDVFDEMNALAGTLGLGDAVEFTGRLPDADVVQLLSTADVCLSPDPLNPLNNVSTMNKVVEYMAIGKPIVSYELAEARVSAAESASYARANDVADFARHISQLLDDPARRRAMGQAGLQRIENELSWAYSEAHLLAAYERAMWHRNRHSSRAS